MIDYSVFDKANAAYERDVNAQLAKKDRENPGWDKEMLSRFTFKQEVMKKHREAMDAGRRRMYETSPGGTYDSFIEYNNPLRSPGDTTNPVKYMQLAHAGNSEEDIRAMGYTGVTPEHLKGNKGKPGSWRRSKYRPESAQGSDYFNTLAKDIDMPMENRIGRNIKKAQKEDPSLFKPSGTMYNLPTPGTPSYGRPGTYDPQTSIFTPTDGYGTGGFLSEAQKQARDPHPDVVKNQAIAYRNKNIGGPNQAYEKALEKHFGAIKSGRMRSNADYMNLPKQWYGQEGSENWYPNPPGWNDGITPDIKILGDGTGSRTQAPGASADSIKSAYLGARERATQYQAENPTANTPVAPVAGEVGAGNAMGRAAAVDPIGAAPAPGDADSGPVVKAMNQGSGSPRSSARSSQPRRSQGYLTGGSSRQYYKDRFS